jgi:P27 family predicted phage terminase small subunit
VLFGIDRDVLVAYVQAADRLRAAMVAQENFEVTERAAGRDGLTTATPNGAVMPSPLLAIINRSAAAMVKIAAELGFTPASRPRLAAATGQSFDPGMVLSPGEDDFDAFIASNPQAN